MDKSENSSKRCPFPQPIKTDPTETESSWKANESFPKLRLVRVPDKKCRDRHHQRQSRTNVSQITLAISKNECDTKFFHQSMFTSRFSYRSQGIRKLKGVTKAVPSSVQFIDKMNASEIQCVKDLQTTFKNNIDRINADWEKKLQKKEAEMDVMLRRAKLKKWCPNCLKEVKFDTDFNPSACSIECWKKLL